MRIYYPDESHSMKDPGAALEHDLPEGVAAEGFHPARTAGLPGGGPLLVARVAGRRLRPPGVGSAQASPEPSSSTPPRVKPSSEGPGAPICRRMSASVKGIFLAGAVASVRKAIREGRVAREQVEIRLEGHDVPFLDEKVDIGQWYPVATLGHFLDVLADLMGGDHPEALRSIGRAAADMAAKTGRYDQLDPTRKAGDSPTEVLRYGRVVLLGTLFTVLWTLFGGGDRRARVVSPTS